MLRNKTKGTVHTLRGVKVSKLYKKVSLMNFYLEFQTDTLQLVWVQNTNMYHIRVLNENRSLTFYHIKRFYIKLINIPSFEETIIELKSVYDREFPRILEVPHCRHFGRHST